MSRNHLRRRRPFLDSESAVPPSKKNCRPRALTRPVTKGIEMKKTIVTLLVLAVLMLINADCDDRSLAERGNAKAQNNLGLMHYKGDGVLQDYNEAAKWYRLAAEQGNAKAQCVLGVMYYKGDGVPQDYKEAVKWLRLAAEQGNAKAQYNLGRMYYTGEGVP